MPGIFEFLFIGSGESVREKTIAHLKQAYQKAYTVAMGVEKIRFPLTGVITVAQKIKFGKYDNLVKTFELRMAFRKSPWPAYHLNP
jgi:hypothetical protein